MPPRVRILTPAGLHYLHQHVTVISGRNPLRLDTIKLDKIKLYKTRLVNQIDSALHGVEPWSTSILERMQVPRKVSELKPLVIHGFPIPHGQIVPNISISYIRLHDEKHPYVSIAQFTPVLFGTPAGSGPFLPTPSCPCSVYPPEGLL